MADEATRRVVADIPLLKTKAGPRDEQLWVQRLKEEFQALIKVSGAACHGLGRLRGTVAGLRGTWQG